MNKDRRKFLKILLIGSGTLLVGKVVGPLFSGLLDNSKTKEAALSENSGSFKIVEDKKTFSIYDRSSGEEIFQIDKGA